MNINKKNKYIDLLKSNSDTREISNILLPFCTEPVKQLLSNIQNPDDDSRYNNENKELGLEVVYFQTMISVDEFKGIKTVDLKMFANLINVILKEGFIEKAVMSQPLFLPLITQENKALLLLFAYSRYNTTFLKTMDFSTGKFAGVGEIS